MATHEFRLSDPGEGLVEAEIVTWRVATGDVVAVNDILLEIETSKSLVELPSPYAGTVTALLAAEGDTVDVGAPVVVIDDGADAPVVDDLVPELPGEQPDKLRGEQSAANGRVPVLVGYGPRTGESKRRPRKGLGGPVREEALALVEPQPMARAVLAKPPVRKLAKDLGVELASLVGSGEGGVVTRADVESAAAESAAAGAAMGTQPVPSASDGETAASDGATAASDGETRIPVKGVRKATAEAMVRSAFSAPHVTEWLTCDVTASVELVDRLRQRREFADLRVSMLVLAAKAVCLALTRTPDLNASWDDDSGEIVLKRSVNLGIAAATPRGLLVPNVKDAQLLPLPELARAVGELVVSARDGRTSPADLARGTFTLTNVGVFGVDAGTPILNPGEVGILCLGAVARRPWVLGVGTEERIEPRWVTTLAISFDHRVVDGEHGSRFLADVAGILGDPATALLF